MVLKPERWNPQDMALRGKIGAFVQQSRHDMRDMTRAARETRWANLLAQADPEGVLPEAERERRAKALLSAHMARASLSRSRAARKRHAAPPTAGAQ